MEQGKRTQNKQLNPDRTQARPRRVRPEDPANNVTTRSSEQQPVRRIRPEERTQQPVRRARPAEGTQQPVRRARPAEGTQQPVRRTRPAEGTQQPVRRARPAESTQQRSGRASSKEVSADRSVKPEKQQTSVQRKKVQKKKSYKKAFLTILIIFSSILVAALICLWFFLSSFEKSRPEHYAQTIIENIQNGKLEELHLTTADGISLDDGSIMSDKDAISDIIKSKADSSKITFRRISAESDGEKNVYLVKAGDEKLLKVEMEKADKKDIFSFSDWKEKKTVLLSADFQPKVINAQIPTTSKLCINEKEVPRENITVESGEIELLNNLRNWGIIGEQPKVTSYAVSGIWTEPKVTCITEGKDPVVCVLKNGLHTAGFEADQSFIDSVYDRVIRCMEPYAYYFSGDAGRGALSSIMLDNSPAYENAVSADVSWMQEHSDVQITEKKAENFKHYSEGLFSCDISFMETIYQGEEAVKTWDTNMTWIFVQDGDEYYLADFVTNVGD